MDPECEVVVCKVGGSLQAFSELADAIRQLAADLTTVSGVDRMASGVKLLLIPGGGGFADHVRWLTPKVSLSDEAAHWLAIRTLSVSALFLQQILPDATLIEKLEQLTPGESGLYILDPWHFLRDAGRMVPVGWHVTSDSIAAYVAQAAGASRLLLLKSVGTSETVTIREAVRAGWVDEHFPNAARGLTVECINVRTGDRCFLLHPVHPA